MTTLAARIAESTQALKRLVGDLNPQIGIILGTGLSRLGDEITVSHRVPYTAIPHFARSTVESHAGELVFGTLAGKRVVAMRGRFHVYEGYSYEQITHPVRVMKALGVHTLVVSNACGGMHPQWRVGDIMLIDDHINMLGGNPLTGPNDPALGPRFPDMSVPYDRELMRLAEAVALESGIRLQRGVYVAVAGPNLETRAEYRFLRAIGADVVGMSTVPEVIVAAHQGTRVLGFSIITDSCLPDALKPAELSEIIRIAGEAEPRLVKIVSGTLARL